MLYNGEKAAIKLNILQSLKKVHPDKKMMYLSERCVEAEIQRQSILLKIWITVRNLFYDGVMNFFGASSPRSKLIDPEFVR